ncbi:MAG: hypothetical protein ACI8S6_003245 [Myxococcota bacterium]
MRSTRALLAGLLLLLVLLIATRGGLPPYDDALFFTRLARNLYTHGVSAWNPIEGPVHGSTSQLHQLLVAALYAITPTHTVAAARLVLAGALWAGVGVLLLGRRAPLPVVLALGSPIAIATVLSGMETALVLLIGCIWLSTRRPAATALLGAVLYLARPDAALLPAVSLGLSIVSGPNRRQAALALLAMLSCVAAILGWLHLSYGSALPLSFYLKTGLSDVYDPAFLARSHQAGLRHLLLFGLTVAPLLLVCAHDRRSWRLLLPPLAFVAFHASMTVDVMGLHARFYVPCLPWIAHAAAVAWPAFVARRAPGRIGTLLLVWAVGVVVAYQTSAIPTASGWSIGQLGAVSWAGFGMAVLAALLGRGPLQLVGVVLGLGLGVLSGPGPGGLASDEVYARRLSGEVTSWRGIEQLRRCLGEEVHLFHSEIGVPGVLLPEARITDLGGLMSPALASGEVGVEALCLDLQPDAIFLPHRNYEALNVQLREGRCLEGYVQVVSRGSSPLLIRRDRLASYECGGD